MSRSTPARRIALVLAALLVLALVVAVVAGAIVVRRPLPQVSGEAELAGLDAKVSVLRDGRGVPTIVGDSVADLARAEGFVHAQDRFFEMDLRRHVTAGRLAELIGPAGVDSDRVMRTLGWRRVVDKELPTLAPETRQFLQAYAEGVNAYLKKRTPSQVALEYTVLSDQVPGYAIDPWTPADSIAWLKAMAWDLKADYANEILRGTLAGRMPWAQIQEIFPAYPVDRHPTTLVGADWSPSKAAAMSGRAAGGTASERDAVMAPGVEQALQSAQRALNGIPELVGRGDDLGSNAWVVSGAHSTTGKPILANDPHLATSNPGPWYQVSLRCRTVSASCPMRVSGFSLAGVPGVIIGHTEGVAWGLTNLTADTTDFFLEKLNGDTYLRDGAWKQLTSRSETITVPGGDPVTVTVRETVHGPIVSDILPMVATVGERAPVAGREGDGTRHEVSLAWTGFTPGRSADAIYRMNTATDAASLRAAAGLLQLPAQNVLFADTRGAIGYTATGWVPVRKAALDGTPPGYWPAPGWDSAYDWKGWVPTDQLPWVIDPQRGMLVSANNRVAPTDRPFLTSEWDSGFRALRIEQLLASHEKLSAADMATLQTDRYDPFGARLVISLRAVDLGDDAFTREAQNLLTSWQGYGPPGGGPQGAAAAYVNAVWANLVRLTFNDEIPDGVKADGGARWRLALLNLLDKPKSLWWDNKQTAGVTEGRDEILRQALVQARLELTRKLGKDPNAWQWSRLHTATMRHRVLGGDASPALVRWLFNSAPQQVGGSSAVVDATGWNASIGYEVTAAPSMRMVVDLANPDASTWVNLTGQSGHVFSGHHGDQLEAWASGEQYPWPFTDAAVQAATRDELTLVPSAP